MKLIRPLFLIGLISLISAGAAFAQTNASLAGSVTDANGAIVVGAAVSVQSPTGARKDVVTNGKGEYTVNGLAAGKYKVTVFATKFELYENTEVQILAAQKNDLIVVLTVGGIVENVDVSNNDTVSNDPDNNADATILKEKDIEALPDDPDELQAYLQALAGASAGPNGGQIYIDGFTGGQLPSKESIREIRINSNPFSAEYDRPGFGRIEILTRPGSDKFRGSANGSFNDESLNSRNPFALNRASTQQKRFGGSFSGPIKKGKASFFVDVSNNLVDNNVIINAQILNPTLAISSFRQDVGQPNRNFRINPRVDFAINDRNTVVLRYSYNRNSNENQGLSETSLPSRAYDTTNREHEIRLTETMIINPKTVNETRFEYSDNLREQNGDNRVPTINVSSAFISGGASIGNSFNKNKTWEINNFTSTSFGKGSLHSVKVGGKLRNVKLTDRSENNYAGTFLFPGFFLAAGTTDACDLDTDGIVSSIEQYRCKITGAVGTRYNPTQFSLTAGNPVADVSQTEGALFFSDDWKVVPALLLSFGLRYENQSNIKSNFNFAPRFGFAYSPGAGGARTPKTVFRGGAGIFYDRFGENSTLTAERFNGSNQLSILVSANDTDPVRRAAAITLLSQPIFTYTAVTNVPTVTQILAGLPQANTIRGVSPVFQAPYTMQAVLSIERQLFSKYTLSTTFVRARTLHQVRSRNINAPVCITISNCVGAVRPDPTRTNVNFFESSGTSDQTRVNVNLRANISPKYTFTLNYGLGFVKGDADGAGPAYSYDLSDEYSRASFDTRHSVIVTANIRLPWEVTSNIVVTASTGVPFNITRGIDANGDGLITERPTFAALGDRCAELNLSASWCDISGFNPNDIIPRNFGVSPGIFTTTLRLNKNFGFGKTAATRAGTAGAGAGGRAAGGGGFGGFGGGPGGGGPGGGPGGGGGFGGGGFGGGEGRRPYNLNVGLSFNNLFNTVNLASPVGSLTSFRFGQSTSTRSGGFGGFGGGGFGGGSGGPNRRIELNMRFNW